MTNLNELYLFFYLRSVYLHELYPFSYLIIKSSHAILNYDFILDVYELDIPVCVYDCFVVWVQTSGL